MQRRWQHVPHSRTGNSKRFYRISKQRFLTWSIFYISSVKLISQHVCMLYMSMQATCGESCAPCKDRCQFDCGHRPCGKPCSEPCDVCSFPCRWFCAHHRCQLPCHQPCVRPPCDHPCNNILPCRHRCIGLCGEPCVPLCGVCNSKVIFHIVLALLTTCNVAAFYA